MATWNLTAVQCPPLVVESTVLDPAVDSPVAAPEILNGETEAATDKAREIAVRLDITGNSGGGGHAAVSGLLISAVGQVCTVTAGWSMGRGPAVLAATATVPGGLADNAYNWIWQLQDGSLTKTSSATATPVPAAPAGAVAYLGRIQVTAGVAGTEDYSGRWELRNGTLWRRTGDAAAPTDTPAAGLLFVTVTAGGTYLWNGLAYVRLAVNAPVDAQYLTLATNAELTGERVLVAGAGLALTDGGAGGNATLDVNVDGATLEINADALRVKALGITDAHVAAANKDGAAGTASLRTLGAGAVQAAAGDHTHTDLLSKAADDSIVDGVDYALGTATGTKLGTAANQKLGFHGATPVVQDAGWSVSNVTPDRSFDADSTTLDEVADTLGTLITALLAKGILGA